MKSPAEIIRALLIDREVADESLTADWAAFVGFFPNDPNYAICIFDTDGMKDGRLMRTGEVIEHPGIQIQVRGKSYGTTFTKANDISMQLDAQTNRTLIIGEDAYTVVNVSRTSPILHIGRETQGNRDRHLFSINALITIETPNGYLYVVQSNEADNPEFYTVQP